LIEIGRGGNQRIERPSVVAEVDCQLSRIQGENDFDPPWRHYSAGAVIDHVGIQFLEEDQKP
jgi:hypothetical protein